VDEKPHLKVEGSKRPSSNAPRYFQECGACGFFQTDEGHPDFAFFGHDGQLHELSCCEGDSRLRELGISHNGAILRGRLYDLWPYTCARCGAMQLGPGLCTVFKGQCSLVLLVGVAVMIYLIGWTDSSWWEIPLLVLAALLGPFVLSSGVLNSLYFRRASSVKRRSCEQCGTVEIVEWSQAEEDELVLICAQCGEQSLTTHDVA